MSRQMRAKQFAPFDALKGLQDALRLEEYKHERSEKGDIPQEKIEKISKVLSTIEKGDIVEVIYFLDGYNKTIKGKSKVDIIEQKIYVDDKVITFDDIYELKKL